MSRPATPVVLLAGVPGAGKSRALRVIARARPEVRLADPDRMRLRLSRLAPALPYSAARPIVHTLAHLAVLTQLLRPSGTPLVIHDPGTRRWSRRLILRLALRRGLLPAILCIDIGREEALAGQHARGRVVRPAAFEAHWRRWQELRARVLAGGELSPGEEWPEARLVTRATAVPEILRRVDRGGRDRVTDTAPAAHT
ncbi:AAA family ATPase [Brevibacterium salitolerans]|jgi:predicted kinase|uniref:AAA domain-containing protein n=1 Tax=Brevibacterium salitolerans TaxID=1403566 RepID=A0ABP5IHV2_9MICO